MNVGSVYTSTVTSNQFRIGEMGQPSTSTWEIVIKRNDDAAIIADEEWDAIQNEAGSGGFHLPLLNQEYATTPPAGMTWEGLMRARTISYRSGPRGILLATVEWSTLYILDPEQTASDYVLPSSVEYSSRARAVTIYRTGWTVQPPTTASNLSAEIGGTAIGGGFVGKPEQVNQVAIRVRTTLDASADAMDLVYGNRFTIVGKRNTDAVGGFPAYSLLCEGVSAVKIGGGYEFYEVVFDLVWDRWYHFEQVPTIAEAGLPRQNSSFGPDEVKWQRLELPAAAFLPVMFPDGSGGTETKWRDRTLKGFWVP